MFHVTCNMITKITKGKQITIPAKIFKELNLKVGNPVEVDLKDHDIIISPIDEDIEKLFREAKKTKPKIHLSAEEMDEVIENEIH
jgi:AbrB family looped-hinge helix DNA binding protein